ncbi:hypothetical protein BDR06DRAFT_1005096 [Suillus hirtellus]|nr:hypothetical protein BDR06DRAFT_1005096 [Suillus hirtellus]
MHPDAAPENIEKFLRSCDFDLGHLTSTFVTRRAGLFNLGRLELLASWPAALRRDHLERHFGTMLDDVEIEVLNKRLSNLPDHLAFKVLFVDSACLLPCLRPPPPDESTSDVNCGEDMDLDRWRNHPTFRTKAGNRWIRKVILTKLPSERWLMGVDPGLVVV